MVTRAKLEAAISNYAAAQARLTKAYSDYQAPGWREHDIDRATAAKAQCRKVLDNLLDEVFAEKNPDYVPAPPLGKLKQMHQRYEGAGTCFKCGLGKSEWENAECIQT
jgi:hypothetical protein